MMRGLRERKENLLRTQKLYFKRLRAKADIERTRDNKQSDTIGLCMSLQNQQTILERYITCSNISKDSTKPERKDGTHVKPHFEHTRLYNKVHVMGNT
jgi:hypothetical protein